MEEEPSWFFQEEHAGTCSLPREHMLKSEGMRVLSLVNCKQLVIARGDA